MVGLARLRHPPFRACWVVTTIFTPTSYGCDHWFASRLAVLYEKRRVSFRLVVSDRNPQSLHPAIQVGTVRLQPSRSFGNVARGHRHGARDQELLVLVESVAERVIER